MLAGAVLAVSGTGLTTVGCGTNDSARPPWQATTVATVPLATIPTAVAQACSFNDDWVSASVTSALPDTPPSATPPTTLSATPPTTSPTTLSATPSATPGGETLAALRGQRPNSGAPGPTTTVRITDGGEVISFVGRYRQATVTAEGIAAIQRCISTSRFADLTADELGTTGTRPDGSKCSVGDAVTTTVVAATPEGIRSVRAYSLGLPGREQSAFACLRHSTALVAVHGQLRQIANRTDELGTPWEPTQLWVRADDSVRDDKSISPGPPSMVWPGSVTVPITAARVIKGDDVTSVLRSLAAGRTATRENSGTTKAPSTDRSDPAAGAATWTGGDGQPNGFRYLVLLPGDPLPE